MISGFWDVSMISLYFFNYFGDKYGVRGSRFGEQFGSSNNDPQGIGICGGTLISHFGIIETPTIPYTIIEKQQKH